jgi:hypothetical protein
MRKILFAAVAASTLSACAMPAYYPDGATSYAPHQGPVKVLTAYPADGTYERLGTIVVRGAYINSEASMKASMQELAAQAGGNAVVVPKGRVFKRMDSLALHPAFELSGTAIRVKE